MNLETLQPPGCFIRNKVQKSSAHFSYSFVMLEFEIEFYFLPFPHVLHSTTTKTSYRRTLTDKAHCRPDKIAGSRNKQINSENVSFISLLQTRNVTKAICEQCTGLVMQNNLVI